MQRETKTAELGKDCRIGHSHVYRKQPAPYSSVHARGMRALRLYLESKEDMGVIVDFLFDANHRLGQLHYSTHLRTQTDIVVPEVKRLARTHDLDPKWFARYPPEMVDDEMPVRVSIGLLGATPAAAI